MKKVKRFTFSEYLKELPSAIVFKHLVKEQGVKRKIISSELIETIKKEFTSEPSCRARFEALAPEVRKICVLTYLFGAGGLKTVEFEKHHAEVMTSFLVYSALDGYSTPFYFGFKDVEKLLAPVYASFLCEHAFVNVDETSVPFLRMRCLSDFAIVLILALRGMLKKKRDGGLVQASLAELKKLLHTAKESCVFIKMSEDIAAIIQLFLSYGTARGYLTEDEKSFETTHTQITQWLSHSYDDLYSDFIDFAVENSGAWSMDIFQEILNRAGSAWLSTSFFPASCSTQALSMLQIMHYVGAIEAKAHGKDIMWRRSDAHMEFHETQAKQKVHILPDFSAIIPQEVLPEVIYAFSLVGTITQFDRVYKGTIDRTVVNEALSRGIAGEVLVSHLSEWETPVNVIETVKEWIREFSRISVLSAETIVTFDEKTSRQINSYRALEALIEPLDTHAVFAIKKGREREVRDILTAMGFDPRVPEMQGVTFPTAERIILKDTREECTLSYDFDGPAQPVSRPVPSGKYSEELQERELNELFHVIDYAVLMGHALKFEYEGSPYIKQGIYTIRPVKITNDTEPVVEGKSEESKAVKKYYMKRIKRIGVLAS